MAEEVQPADPGWTEYIHPLVCRLSVLSVGSARMSWACVRHKQAIKQGYSSGLGAAEWCCR